MYQTGSREFLPSLHARPRLVHKLLFEQFATQKVASKSVRLSPLFLFLFISPAAAAATEATAAAAVVSRRPMIALDQ